MLFSSLSFIFIFLPAFLLVYYCTPARFRNVSLLLGSMVFYALGELTYFPLLLLTLLLNYSSALLLRKMRGARRKVVLTIMMLYDFGILLAFKYFTEAIPLGISFYTFQVASYVLDVYKRKIRPTGNIVEMGTYLCLFPQLIAGPIILYSDIIKQIREREYRMGNLEDGLKTFVLGLSSKILLADVMGKLWNEIHVVGFESISTPMAWLGAAAYSLEIFFDFNGYSLMAIGLGRILGFSIPKNFDKPYLSRTVSEFWRRWHITLGRWFREYVYIPLGGSRVGTGRVILNLLVVWLFTGVWHGKGWNFILWGVSIWFLVVLEKLGLEKIMNKHLILSRIYMLLYIPLSWMLFAINDLEDIGVYFTRLFPFFSAAALEEGTAFANMEILADACQRYGGFFIAALILCLRLPSKIYEKYKEKAWMVLLLTLLFGMSVMGMIRNTSNPFLYFRF